MKLRDLTNARERRIRIEQEARTSLQHVGSFTFEESIVSKRNCENLIGAMQVPLGIAGPLQIKNEKRKSKNYYIPLATTEGALVASVNRGCKAITDAGGASGYAYRIGTTRGPVFYTKSIVEDQRLYTWITEHTKRLSEVAEETSRHLKVLQIEISGATPYIFLRIYFDTEDAMGMNMATIATEKMVEFIEKETGVACLSVAGNFDVDKKPSWLNVINKRGWQAGADIVLSQDVVSSVLKTTPEKFFKTWLAKCMVGSALSGSLGFNSHMANVLAAIFIATGQDPAHVVEGSCGLTTAEVLDSGSLRVSVYLPALMIGTVGGGTNLATQKEALSILGVSGDGNVHEFAEIVAGAVLAGEISLLASLSEGSLTRAHQKLARAQQQL
ncbi:hydroxymethylglutaryl-CoA reductase [Candidatus Roizmanbacteria bacterium]|nr:hydroxymethylglutaryl-CoA reductase [Candidatus Roizmanbacteria bacterium]